MQLIHVLQEKRRKTGVSAGRRRQGRGSGGGALTTCPATVSRPQPLVCGHYPAVSVVSRR